MSDIQTICVTILALVLFYGAYKITVRFIEADTL